MKKLQTSAASQFIRAKEKKAQSMSINTIIVAAIALIVLVVMVFIFNDKISLFGNGVSTCNGICVSGISDTKTGFQVCEDNFKTIPYTFNPAGKCLGTDGKVDKNKACCVEVKIN